MGIRASFPVPPQNSLISAIAGSSVFPAFGRGGNGRKDTPEHRPQEQPDNNPCVTHPAAPWGKMLLHILIPTAKQKDEPLFRLIFGALCQAMDSHRLRQQVHTPSGPLCPEAPIHLFRVQKKPFIKGSDGVDHRSPDQKTRTHDCINRYRGCTGSAPRREPMPQKTFGENPEGCGKSVGRLLFRSVRVEEKRSNAGTIRRCA